MENYLKIILKYLLGCANAGVCYLIGTYSLFTAFGYALGWIVFLIIFFPIRPKQEVEKRSLNLAIDFDDTIAHSKFPTILGLRKDAKEVINRLYEDGHFIIIWTCRCDGHAEDARNFLIQNGIKFHTLNEHNPELIRKYNNNTRKISGDLYIDDKNISGLPSWKKIYKIVNQLATKPAA